MPGRERLLSVVEVVGAYIWGRDPAVRRCAGGERPPFDADESAQPRQVAYPDPGPVRPCPADKPTTVAHYQALADQVANERRLSRLVDHARLRECHGGPLREARLPSVAATGLGGRHG